MTPKPAVYLVFGPQGSGKSTQAEYLADYLKLPFFDSGEQLRSLAHNHGELANLIRETMLQGQLVPNKVLRQVFSRFLTEHDCRRGLVIDGFPRTMEQGELLKELTIENGWELIVIYIDITDQTAQERLMKRYTVIDGKKVVREDDQPAIVAKRLALFKQETLPVIEWLSDNYRYHHIDGEPSRESVFAAVKKVLQ